MKTQNVKIESTMLGFEDHGILTYMITVTDGPTSQGFGGYSLGGEYTTEVIKSILNAVGVERWEDLKGKYVRIQRDKELNSRIKSIGHIIEDKWYTP